MKRPWQWGLHLLTGVRRNVKNHLLSPLDKLLPTKQSTIKTLFATLKRGMGHTCHHSPISAFLHLLFCPAACSLAQQFNRSRGTVPIPNLSSTLSGIGVTSSLLRTLPQGQGRREDAKIRTRP